VELLEGMITLLAVYDLLTHMGGVLFKEDQQKLLSVNTAKALGSMNLERLRKCKGRHELAADIELTFYDASISLHCEIQKCDPLLRVKNLWRRPKRRSESDQRRRVPEG
jgi:hypothetical protein